MDDHVAEKSRVAGAAECASEWAENVGSALVAFGMAAFGASELVAAAVEPEVGVLTSSAEFACLLRPPLSSSFSFANLLAAVML